MFSRLIAYLDSVVARDPAPRSRWEVLLYPGVWAVGYHRLAHALFGLRLFFLARAVNHFSRLVTAIDIHPGATIGHHLFIDHGFTVIGETAEIGDDCTIYQGVTLGGTRLYKGAKRHPTLGKGVVVGAGAQVLGGFTVGDGARIGSNAVVVKPVPAGATAVGNPARLIEAKNNTSDSAAPAEQAQASGAQTFQTTEHSDTTQSAPAAAGSHTDPASQMIRQEPADQPVHPANAQGTATKLSPCDAGWDAAPLKALLDKGAPASGASPLSSASDTAGFTAYAVDPGAGDPLVKVLHELINHAAAQDARIAQLCQTIEAMGSQVKGQNAPLDAQRLNKLVDE